MNENETRKGNEAGASRIDMGTEFRESFDHSAITARYIEQAVRLVLETNPVERIILPVGSAPDEIKKNVIDRTQKSVQTWLDTFDALLMESKPLAVDLMGYAADLARKKRAGLK
jgi:hypothetical protein